jgi:2-oxoglutarate dehydrogenase E1 component
VRLLQEKRKAIDTGKDIDWATGEALAFGTCWPRARRCG